MMNRLRKNYKEMFKVHNPHDVRLHEWNGHFLGCCIAAVWLDHLLFYIPFVDASKLCLSLDKPLAITFCLHRSFFDIFYIFRIFLKFRTAFIDPYSEDFESGQLVTDAQAIKKRYLKSYFIIDILSILPIPQVAALVIVPAVRSWALLRLLMIIIITQNIIRFLRILPLLKEETKTSDPIVPETAWGGATWNFCLYLFASHVVGSFWYLGSIGRADKCWRVACANDNNNNNNNNCSLYDLYHGSNNSFVISFCSPFEPSKSTYDYGIYRDAISLQLYKYAFKRLFYGFVWGLRNLSSLGQNLETSNNAVLENLFVVFISISGLILFSILAGNIQRRLQCVTVRLDEMGVKKRDYEHWMSRSKLPLNLRERVREHEEYEWRRDRGVDEESLIRNLPKDLRSDIKRHKYRSLLIKVPMFENMDETVLDALCCRVKPVLYTAGSYIFREGDPIDEMLLITSGMISSVTTNVYGNEPFNRRYLEAGDLCGEELLTWALDPNSPVTLPISTRTAQVLLAVEAFILTHDDLKCVIQIQISSQRAT